MSQWDDELKNHQVHAIIKQLKGFITEKPIDTGIEAEANLRRLKKIINLANRLVTKIDADLVPTILIDQLNEALKTETFFNALENYANTRDPKYLASANNSISNELPRFGQLMSYSKGGVSPTSTKMFEEHLEGLVAQFQSDIAEVNSSISNFQTSLTDIETRQDSAESKLNKLDEDVSAFLNSSQNQFQEDRLNWQEQFNTWMIETGESCDSTVSTLIEENTLKFDRAATDYKEDFDLLKSELEEKHREILDLHGIVVGDAVAAGFDKAYTDERKSANLWRWIAFGSIVCAIISTIVLLAFSIPQPQAQELGPFFWSRTIKSFAVTAGLYVLATYASRQSGLHRKNAIQSQWLSLEVKAIDPYIAKMPEADQHELKKKLSEKLFGSHIHASEQANSGSENSDVSISGTNNLVELIKVIAKSGK